MSIFRIALLGVLLSLPLSAQSGAPVTREAPSDAAVHHEPPVPERTEIQDIIPGQPLDVAMAPDRQRRFRYTPTVSGEVSIWARSEVLDPSLEIFDAESKPLAADEDSGGGGAAHLFLMIEKGRDLTIVVRTKARAGRDGEGQDADREPLQPSAASCRLMAVEAALGDQAEALLADLRVATEEMADLIHEGKNGEARTRGRIALENGFFSTGGLGSSLAAGLDDFGYRAWQAGDPKLAFKAWSLVSEIRRETLPDEHPDLMTTWMNCAITVKVLGNLAKAREIEERVLAVRERTLPEDHPDLQKIRANHAVTLQAVGDLPGARRLLERVLAIRERTLPEGHPDLRKIRMNYASILQVLRDYDEARKIYVHLLDQSEKVLPDEHPDLQIIRQNYASVLKDLGDLDGARVLEERVLAVLERVLPGDHTDLQAIRSNHSNTLRILGDLAGARRIQERVLADLERALPRDHPNLQAARIGLADTLRDLGDLPGARALQERVLAIREQALPQDHPDLQRTRMGYATTLFDLGDLHGALALQQRVLSVYERTLPEEHPDLQALRLNYASTLYRLGELEGARSLQERALVVLERSLPEEHPRLQANRNNLALTLKALGDLDGALALERRVLAALERVLPKGHPDYLAASVNHANTLEAQGDLVGARRIAERVLPLFGGSVAGEHADLRRSRIVYAEILERLAGLGDREAASSLVDHVARSLDASTPESWSWRDSLSRRQIALRSAEERELLDTALSIVEEGPERRRIYPRAFLLAESLRSAGLRVPRLKTLLSSATGDVGESIARLRAELDAASRALESFLAKPEVPEDAAEGETVSSRLAVLVREKERRERVFEDALRGIPGAARLLRKVSNDEIAKALPQDALAVTYVSYRRWSLVDPDDPRSDYAATECLVAFVLAHGGTVTGVKLGPLDPVREMIGRFRSSMTSSGRGGAGAGEEPGIERPGGIRLQDLAVMMRLRETLWDPIERTIESPPARLVVSLPGELALLPFDALALEGGGFLGDRTSISVVASFDWVARDEPSVTGAQTLLALGGIDYAREGAEFSADDRKRLGEVEPAVTQRGDEAHGARFDPLAASGQEISAIGRLHSATFGESESRFLFDGRRAEEKRLRAMAPRARYLHLATHGWFAPDSVPSILDRRETKDGIRLPSADFRDEVCGYEPLALCGLALAGANLPPNEDGSHPGLVLGSEIAQLDLSNCELAVLSACETNVGVRRAGQGIASLQEALFMAGARNTITSLWKVPDEATKELMARFYEGIWRRGETKREALWNAKRKLRDAKDARTGKPLYGLRDWAGWVLVGHPE